MRHYLLLAVFLLTPILLFSKSDARIQGRVVEVESNEVVEFANVILYLENNSDHVAHVTTDEEGKFDFKNLKYGRYTLLVRFVGYDVLSKEEIILSEAQNTLNLGTLELSVLETGLGEVVIEANKRQVIYKLDKKVIDASSNIMASGGSAVDILENTPSIRVGADGDVTFRGSSGFTVYVDGKPSVFSGSQALEHVPASLVENIEIITTPSARHDTEGDVGIINIITKQKGGQGFSGMVNTSGSTMGSSSVDFLLNQQNEKARWYFGGNWNRPVRKSTFDQEKTTIVGNETITSHSHGPRKGTNVNYSGKAGMGYLFTPRTNFGVEAEIGYAQRLREGDLFYTEKKYKDGTLYSEGDYNSRDDYDLHETYYQGTLDFDHKFNDSGHKITSMFYLKYGGDALEYFESDLMDMKGKRAQGHRAWEDEYRWTVRSNIDYVYPYSRTGTLEAGHQYFSYSEDGDYSMQYWDPAIQDFYWRDDIYNTFYFQRGVNSFYLLGADSYRTFDLQLGLRGEHTQQQLKSSKTWANRKYYKFEFFPSAHLAFNGVKAGKLTASYSRRITRPELFFMEPYITYRDFYSAEIGNPDIRPEYINSYEMNFKRDFEDKHTLSVTAFYRHRKDKIERLRVPYEAGVTLDSMANVGNDHSIGMELNLNVQPLRWWNVNLNGNVYHYKVKNKLTVDGGRTESSTNYDVLLNNTFDIGKTTKVQVDGNFVGPSVRTQGRESSFWYVNLGVRQQLINRKLIASLTFRDVFNSARYVSDISTSNLQSVTRIRPKYPLISLSLSYTFNNFRRKSSESTTSHDLFEGTNH